MKHGKKPAVAQCNHIRSFRLNPENWLVSRDNKDEMVLVHRQTDRQRVLPGRSR